MAANNRVSIAQVPIQAFTLTGSYVLAKCLASNCHFEEITVALFKWSALRRRFRAKDQAEFAPEFSLAAMASAICREDMFVNKDSAASVRQNHRYLRELAEHVLTGTANPLILGQFTEGTLDWTQLAEVANKSREEQVAWVETLVKSAQYLKLDPAIRAFVLGYSVSLISDGSFEHYKYLADIAGRDPEALLWYGFCVGAHKSRRALSAFGGLARRILRELDNHWFPGDQRPQSDISFEELMVLSRDSDQVPDVRRFSKSSLRVELIPGVSTFIRAPIEQTSEERIDVDGLVLCLEQLDSGIERLKMTTRKIGTIVGDKRSRTRRRGK